jgi:uncharacterized protein YbjT (DUF2867 family)
MTALLLGSTGLVGRQVLDLLASDTAWERVTTLGRREMPALSPRHVHRLVDFERLGDAADAFAVDAVFCALGATIRDAGSEEAFARVDYEYVVAAARLARDAGAVHFLLVTALGASPSSRIFYNRLKGETERDVVAHGPLAVSIFRPSLLTGDRKDRRRGEVVMGAVLAVASPLLRGPLRKYRATPARAVAHAMVAVARAAAAAPTHRVYEADEIMDLAARAMA